MGPTSPLARTAHVAWHRASTKARPRRSISSDIRFVEPAASSAHSPLVFVAQPAGYLRSLSPAMLMPLPPLCCSCRSKLSSCQSRMSDGRVAWRLLSRPPTSAMLPSQLPGSDSTRGGHQSDSLTLTFVFFGMPPLEGPMLVSSSPATLQGYLVLPPLSSPPLPLLPPPLPLNLGGPSIRFFDTPTLKGPMLVSSSPASLQD